MVGRPQIWRRRAEWIFREPTPTEALTNGERTAGGFPIGLADQGDNTGGGAPGDATHILRLFLARELEAAAVLYMVDPEAAAAAHAAGVGATIELEVGGKSHPNTGPPVLMTAVVEWAGPGIFTCAWPGKRSSRDRVAAKQQSSAM